MGGEQSLPEYQVESDRTFLVTGGNTGIGYETAKYIANLGARVVIGCRSEERARKAIERMQEEARGDTTTNEEREENETTKEIKPLNIQYMHLDLSSFKSTLEFVDAYKASGLPLHVLVCNGGVFHPEKTITDDGFEKMFQVNYLSHFLLTLHLIPLLKESAPDSRIVNISSMAERSFRRLDLANIQAQKSFSGFTFYSNSKAFQIMNMFVLSERLKSDGISVFSVHPGLVETEIQRNLPGWMQLITKSVSAVGVTQGPRTGSFGSLNAALNPELKGQTALYFNQRKVAQPTHCSRDVQNQTKLWEYSLSCLKEHLTDDVLKEVGETLENIRSLEREDGTTGGEVTKEETRKPENEGETKEETDGVKDGGGDSDTKET